MNDCIFCKIVEGKLPSSKVYEDDVCMAFLDINPLTPGHTLLIPKRHCASITEACDEDLSALVRRIPGVATAAVKAAGAEGFSVVQLNGSAAGQVVFHLHFHIIPRRKGDGVSFNWHHQKYGPGEIDLLAEKIRQCLKERS